jgi:hypothetical protein
MSKYINRWCAPLALAVALTAAGCTKDKTSDTLAQDSSLNRDLQMANQDTTAQPALTDVPATSTPTTSAPAATAPVRTTPRPVVRNPAPSRPAPRPTSPAPAGPIVSASGNTVKRGPSVSERRV